MTGGLLAEGFEIHSIVAIYITDTPTVVLCWKEKIYMLV